MRIPAGKDNTATRMDKGSFSTERDDETLQQEAHQSGQNDEQIGLSAALQVLPLPAGLYLFTVKNATARPPHKSGQLSLPAVHVGLGPGTRADQIEFIDGPSTHGAWLFASHDLLVVKIKAGGATLVLSSVRAPGGDVLSIKVERLDTRTDAEPAMSAPAASVATKKPAVAPTARSHEFDTAATDARPALRLQVAAHVRSRGDMNFGEASWAGRVGQGLWMESFSVRPLEHFDAQDIEYKGLTASGFETPWISDNRMCGTKGMSVPLVGFAIRLKPSTEAAAYDCEYSGYFQSGVTVGPLRNGAPCRSTVANDPLEGVQIRLVKRIAAVVANAAGKQTSPSAKVVRNIKSAATPKTNTKARVKASARVVARRR